MDIAEADEPPEQITPEMIDALGGEDQASSFLAALFIVQAETTKEPMPALIEKD